MNKQESFLKVFKLIQSRLKYLIILMFVIYLITIILTKEMLITTKLFISFVGLIYCIIISFTLHEYTHIYFIKRLIKGDIELNFSLLSYSISYKNSIKAKSLILIAVSGPIVCSSIGLIIYLLNHYYLGSSYIYLISYIYLFHIINLIPPLNDGLMVLKGLLTLRGGK